MQNDPRGRLVIRSHQNFVSDVMFIVASAAFALLAHSYRMGTAGSMGPGYFPFWLGVMFALLGVAVVVQSVSHKGVVDRTSRWDVKTLLWVLGFVVLFGLLLQPPGLVLSLVVLALVSSMASYEFTLKGVVGTAIVAVVMGLAAFVYGFRLQFPVWPAFIGN